MLKEILDYIFCVTLSIAMGYMAIEYTSDLKHALGVTICLVFYIHIRDNKS